MGIKVQAAANEDRSRMRLARKLANAHGPVGPSISAAVDANGKSIDPSSIHSPVALRRPAYDNTRLGAAPPSRQAYDRAIEAKVPQARGAAFAASVVGQSDYKSPTDDVSQRVDMGRALLAKKFVGGDLTKGGDSKTRRKIRDAQRYAQFIDAAAKG